MRQAKFIDDILREAGRLLPPGLGEVQHDIDRNLRTVLERAFARMGLVTREEFDVQSAVLARTREKLDDLERRFTALESGPLDTG